MSETTLATMQMYYLIFLDLHPLNVQARDSLESDSRQLYKVSGLFLAALSWSRSKRGYRSSLMTRHAMLSTILYRNHCKSVCTVHHTHQAGHALCRQKSTFLLKVSSLYWTAFYLATYVPAVHLNSIQTSLKLELTEFNLSVFFS